MLVLIEVAAGRGAPGSASRSMPMSTARSVRSSSQSISSSAKVGSAGTRLDEDGAVARSHRGILGAARDLQSRRWPCVRHSDGRASSPGARG